MGLISRVSSRTYRKEKFEENGPESYLQAPFAQKAKQEVRAKPDRSVQENRQQQLATTKGYRLHFDDDTVVKLATQVSVTVPTKIPDIPAETRWVSRSFSFTTWTNSTA